MSDAEQIISEIRRHYGSDYTPKGRLTLREERLFLYTGSDSNLENIWCGLHIANKDLTLTIEGAQIIGPTASKNILDIPIFDTLKYFRGEDITCGGAPDGPVIIRSEGTFIGGGICSGNHISNAVPISRRIK